MSGATDHKRFINRIKNGAFARTFDDWIRQGIIPPFAILFPETETAFIEDDDKPGKDIIQFGFVIRDEFGKVLISSRETYGPGTKAGHTITTGNSVLVGWSPVVLPAGRRFPASEKDILFTFHQEVPEQFGAPAQCIFRGLIKNQIQKQSPNKKYFLRYYFYLFEMQYTETPNFENTHFIKDKNDQMYTFKAIDDALATTLQDRKADLRALDALTGKTFNHIDYGDSLLIRPKPGSPPPFLVHPPGVFISHATTDDNIANCIAAQLEKQGISVWCDHRTLRPGQDWCFKIDEAIKYGPCFIVLCSQASYRSGKVEEEVLKAIARRKQEDSYLIVPIVLEGKNKIDCVYEPLRDSLHLFDFRKRTARLIFRIPPLYNAITTLRKKYQQRKSPSPQGNAVDLIALVTEQVAEYGCLKRTEAIR